MSAVPPARTGLVCPECGASVMDTPPHGWPPGWGPRPSHTHTDGSPLCPVPIGYRPADPIPAGQARAATVTAPDCPPWPGGPAAAVRALSAAVHRLSDTLAAPNVAGPVEAVTAALAETLVAVTGCCHRVESSVTATDTRAGRRMVQASVALDRR